MLEVMGMVQTHVGQRAGASAVLRDRTWPMHQRLEDHAISRALLSPDLTLAQYGQILQAWHACWTQLERLLARHAPSDLPEWAWPAKRAYLAVHDLAYLGQAPLTVDADWGPELPRINGEGAWYGLAYVMQGSGMGGLVIAVHLERLLGLRVGLGASFFNVNTTSRAGSQRPTAKHGWMDWLRWMDQQLDNDPSRVEQAVTAASDTFTYIYNVFSLLPPIDPGVHPK